MPGKIRDCSKAYYVGTHRYSKKAGEPAQIIGVAMVTPSEGATPRPCFRIRFEDGDDNLVPISDNKNYKIISAQDVADGKIPVVVN